ncbi:MAG: hypothetical protein LBV50_12065, partial [Novosphingobium sp.]|nr:hypothetical protein [Novosphingobium sp.]
MITSNNEHSPATTHNSARRSRVLLGSTALAGLATVLLGGSPALAQSVLVDSPLTVIGDGSGTEPSPWPINGTLLVGNSDTGTVTITAGGRVSSQDGALGVNPDTVGRVTVDGSAGGGTPRWDIDEVLRVGDNGTGRLNVLGGGLVQNATGVIGYGVGSDGKVTVSGADSNWVNSVSLMVGYEGFGALAIQNGGYVSSLVSDIGGLGGSVGEARISGEYSAWGITGNLGVGREGSGALIIEESGYVSNTGRGIVGDSAGSEGEVTVTGAGSEWSNGSQLYIGNRGTGDLVIKNGGSVVNTSGVVGVEAGGIGTVTVTGANSIWTNSSQLSIGSLGRGELRIENGGSVSSTEGIIAFDPDSEGTVTVTGAGSIWTNTAALVVGSGGLGSLSIEDGGKVLSRTGIVGSAIGADGAVSVIGADSTWVMTEELMVGNRGVGVLNIEDGGKVSNTHAAIGFNSGSTGTVVVDGAGSVWTNSGNLSIGGAGDGTLFIQNGGSVVSNDQVTIGESSAGTGLAIVVGAGSRWTIDDDLIVGGNGSGTLYVLDGGLVSSTATVDAGSNGGAGTIIIGGVDAGNRRAPGMIEATALILRNANDSLEFNHTGTDYVFASQISGAGAIRQIAGTTILTGDSSGFTGATGVQGGILRVNGALGGITTVVGGVLGG